MTGRYNEGNLQKQRIKSHCDNITGISARNSAQSVGGKGKRGVLWFFYGSPRPDFPHLRTQTVETVPGQSDDAIVGTWTVADSE